VLTELVAKSGPWAERDGKHGKASLSNVT